MELSASPAEDAAVPRFTCDRNGRRRSWRRAIAGIGLAAAAAGWTAVLAGGIAAGPPALAAVGTPSAQRLGEPPGPPTGLTATAGSSQVLLSWTPPASDGQSPVISYEIFEGTSPDGEGTSPVGTVSFSATTYMVTDLTNGTPYYFEVEAVNDAAGAGPASNEVSAVPGGQTITFGPLAAEPAGTAFTVSAAASSGLAVVFSSGTPGVCTVTAAGSVTTVAPGTCTITAAQAGNSDFAAAPDVTQSFQAVRSVPSRRAQTITFGPLAAEPARAAFTVSAAASSGLAVVFSSGTPGVCTVTAAGSVTTVAPGTCTITAAQAGNSAFEPAPDVTQSFPAGQDPAARSPGPLLIILLAAVILAAAAARLVRRYRRVRSHPPAGPGPRVQAEPDSGPPPSASVRVTGTGVTRTVRIEPAPGATTITIEETRP
jgi:Fibronectin type III domain